jgi:hypothetical protein
MLIVIPVDKKNVTYLKSIMIGHLRLAKDVRTESTILRVREAQASLHKAQGMFEVLKGLDLLDDASVIGEDIDRAIEKIDSVLEEKRRKDMPKWRS